MLYHDFMWKGKLAGSMGIVVEQQADYIAPARRVASITVPGRAGELNIPEGDEALDCVTYSPLCWLKPGASREAVAAWLCGQGQVIFGSMAAYRYDAIIVNQIPFVSVFQDAGGYQSFTPIFRCQPMRYHYPAAADITVTTSGTTITNSGTMKAAPQIAVHGNGEITLTVGFDTVILEGVEGSILIDCAMQDCMSLDKGQLLNHKMTGDFPQLAVGGNPVRWTGSVSKVVITPNWRSL